MGLLTGQPGVRGTAGLTRLGELSRWQRGRDPEAPLSPDVTADRLRTAIARACRAAGVRVFSPHDLRHRRISVLHRQQRVPRKSGASCCLADAVNRRRTATAPETALRGALVSATRNPDSAFLANSEPFTRAGVESRAQRRDPVRVAVSQTAPEGVRLWSRCLLREQLL